MQLFRIVRNVGLPIFPLEEYQRLSSLNNERITAVAFFWPSGSPCIPVEMYLLNVLHRFTVREHDGGSLKTVSSQLTHLVRFCFDKKRQFWDLDDASFRDFASNYLNLPVTNSRGFKKRSNNSNRAIIRTCIDFLKWLQSTPLCDKVIVGPPDQSPQIRLRFKRSVDAAGHVSYHWTYPYLPHVDTRDPKGPIANDTRNLLWDSVTQMHDNSDKDFVRRDYLKARRQLLLTLLEATGSRPDELAEIRISENSEPSLNCQLSLPTSKRRHPIPPIRTIRTSFEIAIALDNFINRDRRALVAHLSNQGYVPDFDHVFLSARNGIGLSASAMGKEFQRLVENANLKQRTCMSMFRHRFITIQVALHLRDHLNVNGISNRDEITIVDKISILTRVAAITGHARPESLLPYIDLAWDYLGVFDPIDRARELIAQLDGCLSFLCTLETTVERDTRMTKVAIVHTVKEEISELRKRLFIGLNKLSDSC